MVMLGPGRWGRGRQRRGERTREVVATTGVGRGGGGVLGVAGRVAGAQRGRRWGDEGFGHWHIYAKPLYSQCQPLTESKGPLLPVRVTNRE